MVLVERAISLFTGSVLRTDEYQVDKDMLDAEDVVVAHCLAVWGKDVVVDDSPFCMATVIPTEGADTKVEVYVEDRDIEVFYTYRECSKCGSPLGSRTNNLGHDVILPNDTDARCYSCRDH